MQACILGATGRQARCRRNLPYFNTTAGIMPLGKIGSTTTAPNATKKLLSSILEGLSAQLQTVGTLAYHELQSFW